MQIGISTYTYTWSIGVPGYPKIENPMDAAAIIKKAKELGVGLVQLCDNYPLHTQSDEALKEIKNIAQELGIKLEVGTRGVEPEHLLRYLEITKFLEADLLRIILQKQDGPVGIEEAAALIKEALPEFEAKGVSIAVENHERHRVEELVDLVRRVDSPYLGICLDTVNSFGALEGPKYVIETLAPYTINLHVKDFAVKRLDHMMGFMVTGVPAGTGHLDMDFVLKMLAKYEKTPNVILEQWTPFEDSVEKTAAKEQEWAKESIKYLKECVK